MPPRMPSPSNMPIFFHIATSVMLARIERTRIISCSNPAIGDRAPNTVVVLFSDRMPMAELIQLGERILPAGDCGHIMRIYFESPPSNISGDSSFVGFQGVFVVPEDIREENCSSKFDYLGRLRRRENAPNEQEVTSLKNSPQKL